MWRRFRLPAGAVAVALFGLLVLLAMLQYRWLGQISDADRAQRRARLEHDASEFAQDFDRELARAFLLFQGEPIGDATPPDLATRFAQRYDHWQASSSYPRLLKDVYAFSLSEDGVADLRRYNPASRRLEPAAWPDAMRDWRQHLVTEQVVKETERNGDKTRNSLFVRRLPAAVWETVPALVVPSSMLFFTVSAAPPGGPPQFVPGDPADLLKRLTVPPAVAYTILAIDKDYAARELFPALARRHFSQRPESEAEAPGLDYKVAIVSRTQKGAPIFQSSPSFAPSFEDSADARADLLQVRTQDFSGVAAEVRKLTATATMHSIVEPGGTRGRIVTTETARPFSFVIQQGGGTPPVVRGATAAGRLATSAPPMWRVIVAHPSGSLERAVSAARARNLMVSFGILAILGASMGLLVLTTRRSQRLAQQQMEFVATVSHELRTPLAVIRSAAENLADGVVDDEQRIRRYGELMRSEGRRLTEMVEQILEFAGIQSGQRGFSLKPVAIEPLVRDILSSSSPLIDDAGLMVEVDVPIDLPMVLGDEPALRRVFQNLIDNATKYGGPGKWLRISARTSGSEVVVTVADRGIGIDPSEQSRIFEPFYRAADVVAAQMQGAGLGLSLVQRIVTAHGGSVTVKSAPRNGSEFIVSLPSARRDPVADAADVEPAAAEPRYS
jgi:signal transduction histidine kinase